MQQSGLYTSLIRGFGSLSTSDLSFDPPKQLIKGFELHNVLTGKEIEMEEW